MHRQREAISRYTRQALSQEGIFVLFLIFAAVVVLSVLTLIG